MKKIVYKSFLSFMFFLLWAMLQIATAQETACYPLLNQKSWNQILEESTYKWHPPYTINLLIHPVHSPDWIYVNPSLLVSRRRVTENVSTTDEKKVREAIGQEDLTVLFAFDEPAFIPDFRLTNFKLEENKYPIATADFFANDLYYQIEYVSTTLDSVQTILNVHVAVTNESEQTKTAHVWTKVGYYPENKLFAYHYIPYNWTAKNWLPYKGLSMDHNRLYKGSQIIGEVGSDKMHLEWDSLKQYTDRQYENLLYPQVWYGSGYALSEYRIKEMQDVIHAFQELLPGESTSFSFKLLVNDQKITASHEDLLVRLSEKEIKQKAKADFQKQMNPSKITSVDFKSGQWSDILTELQLNTLQLLIKYPGKTMYQPAQGGSSERFYVWVFEAVQMLHPLLRTGQFEAVKKGLDYIFALQDAGYPPIGRFTTTEGAIGTTGPRWANTTGMALALACDYYLYAKDMPFIQQYLSKILKALHWISGEVSATRKLNLDGSRPLTYGLMPFAVASDGDQGYFVSATDIFTFWGFEKAVLLLESLKHTEAKRMRIELEKYRNDLLVAIRHLAQPNGYIDRKIALEDQDIREATKFINTDIMAPIATIGIIEPQSDLFRKYISYYENHVASDYFMGQMDRDIFYIIQCEHYWQPIYLRLGEWKKAFMTLQTCLKYGMTPDTHQTQERFSKRDPAFAPWQPNGSGNGSVIDMILNALYFEMQDEAIVLGAVPFEFLSRNVHSSMQNLYTLTGKISMRIEKMDANRCLLTLSTDNMFPSRIRIPDYFHAVPEDPSIHEIENGVFKIPEEAKKLRFNLKR